MTNFRTRPKHENHDSGKRTRSDQCPHCSASVAANWLRSSGMRKGEPSSYSVRLHWKMPVAFSERVALSDSVIVDMKCLAYFCIEYRPYRRRHCDFVQLPCVFYDHGASLIPRLPCKSCILTPHFSPPNSVLLAINPASLHAFST